MDAEDEEGETPMDVAVRYGHKKCERHLFMWQWQQRARRVGKRPESPPPWPHQKFDSNLPPLWLTNGPAAQVPDEWSTVCCLMCTTRLPTLAVDLHCEPRQLH